MLTNASCTISGIDIYPATEELYYACEDSVYKVSSTTGGSRTLLVDGFAHVSSIALAVAYDTMWVADEQQDIIYACRLNGTNCEPIYSVETPRFIDVTESVSAEDGDDGISTDPTSSSTTLCCDMCSSLPTCLIVVAVAFFRLFSSRVWVAG